MKKLFLFWLAILLSIGAFAQVKISELPEVTSVSTDNIMIVVKAGVTSKVQKSNLLQEYAPLASPPLTGVPTAPTAAASTNTTQIATTAFATTADNLKANIASPTFTGTVTIPSPFYLGITSVTTTGADLNKLPNMIFGRFYITDYGAIADDEISDAAAIQSAINAAHAANALWPAGAAGRGGTVIIPPGRWLIDVADTLKSYMGISIAQGARFDFAAEYTGQMWVNPTGEDLRQCWVRGGYYDLPNSRVCNFIQLRSVEFDVAYNDFSDISVMDANDVIYLGSSGGVGWNNSNTFSNFVIPGASTAVRIIDGASAHHFDNFVIQTINTVSDTIIYMEDTGANEITNFMIWDFGDLGGDIAMYLDNGSYNNKVSYSGGGDAIDLGYLNKYDAYGYSHVPNLYVNYRFDNDATGPTIYLDRIKDGDPSYDVDASTELGEITFRGWMTDSYKEGASIKATIYGTPSATSMPTNLRFYTTGENSITPVERVRVDTSGALRPATDAVQSLGTSTTGWKDLHIGSTGGTINFNGGDVVLTHTSNTLSLTGGVFELPTGGLKINSNVMTFPTTTATLARTDAGQTFTGHNTFEGVTATGATGTGNMVFSDNPTFTTGLTTPTITVGDAVPLEDAIGALYYVVDNSVGSNDTYTATYAGFEFITGKVITFHPLTANTDGCTLNINGAGAVAIETQAAGALTTNDMVATGFYPLCWDGANWVLMTK